MAESFYFISYSSRDGADTALNLADQLVAGPPSIPVWLDLRKLQPGIDRDEQVLQALRDCQGVLYLMTNDSVDPNCPCTQEWIRALKYKKPVIALIVHSNAELPYRLEPRVPIVFAESSDAGLARLREHLRWRATPEGLLHTMGERLKDARRDLADVSQVDKARIEEEIAQLEQQITPLQDAIKNPHAAEKRTQRSIEHGLERERGPAVPATSRARLRFINRPPLIPPTYFQDRHVETSLIGEFLRNDDLRLMTVVGRGGVGKTAMVCRLLRSLEGGTLPDDAGELALDGIVYLAARSGRPVFPNLFYDLCKLVPTETAKHLDQLYKDPMQSAKAQMQALLAEFPSGRTIVLLDNLEDVIDVETQAIKEEELDEALRAVLETPPHGVKFILTTRTVPEALLRVQPGLQNSLELEQGLKSPYAENLLKAMDTGGTLGLDAKDAPLAEARDATRGFPRALEAIVGILRSDRSTDLRGLLKDLGQLGSRAEDVVLNLVGEAFNRLDPLAQEVIQALAVYGVPVPAVAVDYLLQPYGVAIDCSKTLNRLVNMQFARGEAGRFHLHQVDRDYALSRIVEGEPEDGEIEPPRLTRFALRHRAAEYFKKTRKPREAWKTLEDLTPQLAEFDLRLMNHDYDAAASVLHEIDDGYLTLWGHYRLLADRYERLQGKLSDPYLDWSCTRELGTAYIRTGQFEKGIRCCEHALALARAQQNSSWEVSSLTDLGMAYGDMDDQVSALQFTEQALAISVDIGDKAGEATARANLSACFSDLGRPAEAIEQCKLAIALDKKRRHQESICIDNYNLANLYCELGENATAGRLARDAQRIARTIGNRLTESAATHLLAILMVREGQYEDAIRAYDDARALADDLSAVQMQMFTRRGLALACLLAGDLPRARTFVDDAARYRCPNGYCSVLALGGVVAVRQGETAAASDAFDRTLSEAETRLGSSPRGYTSAYAKALALGGLAVCRDAALARAAADAYGDARAVTAAAGVVTDELRCLDALAAADPTGILKPVRAAAAGEHRHPVSVQPSGNIRTASKARRSGRGA